MELEDDTTPETESISPTRVEEEKSTVKEVKVDHNKENPNDGANPNIDNPTKAKEIEKQKHEAIAEEVMVKYITGQ